MGKREIKVLKGTGFEFIKRDIHNFLFLLIVYLWGVILAPLLWLEVGDENRISAAITIAAVIIPITRG